MMSIVAREGGGGERERELDVTDIVYQAESPDEAALVEVSF